MAGHTRRGTGARATQADIIARATRIADAAMREQERRERAAGADGAGRGPAKIASLTPKQQRFVAEYLVDLNATQAAIRAGYSPKGANRQASMLLADIDISNAVGKRREAQLKRADLSASRVLEELRRLAFADARDFLDEDGNVKPVSGLSAEQGSAIKSLEVVKKNATAGDGITDTVVKIALWDKGRALENLAKHFKLLTEVVQQQEADGREARLTAGRARVAAMARARRGE